MLNNIKKTIKKNVWTKKRTLAPFHVIKKNSMKMQFTCTSKKKVSTVVYIRKQMLKNKKEKELKKNTRLDWEDAAATHRQREFESRKETCLDLRKRWGKNSWLIIAGLPAVVLPEESRETAKTTAAGRNQASPPRTETTPLSNGAGQEILGRTHMKKNSHGTVWGRARLNRGDG